MCMCVYVYVYVCVCVFVCVYVCVCVCVLFLLLCEPATLILFVLNLAIICSRDHPFSAPCSSQPIGGVAMVQPHHKYVSPILLPKLVCTIGSLLTTSFFCTAYNRLHPVVRHFVPSHRHVTS